MESFFDFYNLHKSTDDLTDSYSKTPATKKCRFCQKAYPDVLFDKIPHVIPEFFGRNSVTSNFECDECNKLFQAYETDTATMIQHYLALLNIKSKKGVPVFQSKKDQGSYSTTLNNRNLYFGTNAEDYQFDDEQKTLTVNFRTKKFRPFSVYKIFLKMGISLLTEEELNENSHYLYFLNSKEPIDNGLQIWTAHRYMFKTKYYQTPKINLYKAKQTLIDKSEFPEFVLLINFANIVIQFFMPISKRNMEEHKYEHQLRLELFPAFVLDDITRLKQIDTYYFDLMETEKVSITDKVVLHYDSRTRVNKNDKDGVTQPDC
ncbi:MAG: hypothetical protein JST86_00895 [Bacteroidetes bacterium]|nr:hypothetical protein [Bacteroidota bacterium]